MWPWRKRTPKREPPDTFVLAIMNVGGVRLFVPSNWGRRENAPPDQLISLHGPEGTLSVTARIDDDEIDSRRLEAEVENIHRAIGIKPDEKVIISFGGRPCIRIVIGNPPVLLHYVMRSAEGPMLTITYAFFKHEARDNIGFAIMRMEQAANTDLGSDSTPPSENESPN